MRRDRSEMSPLTLTEIAVALMEPKCSSFCAASIASIASIAVGINWLAIAAFMAAFREPTENADGRGGLNFIKTMRFIRFDTLFVTMPALYHKNPTVQFFFGRLDFYKNRATIHPSANKLVRITVGAVASAVNWEVPSDCRPLYIDVGQTFIGYGKFPEAEAVKQAKER